jgi:predicted kinase
MLVIVGGPPAAGKSFLACKLSCTLAATHVEADRIIRECDHKDVVYKEERRRLLIIIFELLKSGQRVILDDCMHLKSMRKPCRKLCCDLEVPFGIIWICIESIEFLLKRDASREHPAGPETIAKIFNEAEIPLKDVLLVRSECFSEPDVIGFCANLKVPEISTPYESEYVQLVSPKHELNSALCKIVHYYVAHFRLNPERCRMIKKAILNKHSRIKPEDDLQCLFIEEYIDKKNQ